MSRVPTEFYQHPLDYPEEREFRAVVKDVIDGDTLDVLVDLGFLSFGYVTIRVADYDAPEMRDPGGDEARTMAEDLLLERAVKIVVRRRSSGRDILSFGRWVADVWYWDEWSEKWKDFAAEMKDSGHVK